MAGDEYQSRSQLADPGRNEMGIHLLSTIGSRPNHLMPVFSAEPSCIGREFEPGATSIFCNQPHDPVTFESPTDLPISFLCGATNLFAVIPAIDQDMRLSAWDRIEVLDILDCHRNFAPERLFFLLADSFLAVHAGLEWTTLPQQHIQSTE